MFISLVTLQLCFLSFLVVIFRNSSFKNKSYKGLIREVGIFNYSGCSTVEKQTYIDIKKYYMSITFNYLM